MIVPNAVPQAGVPELEAQARLRVRARAEREVHWSEIGLLLFSHLHLARVFHFNVSGIRGPRRDVANDQICQYCIAPRGTTTTAALGGNFRGITISVKLRAPRVEYPSVCSLAVVVFISFRPFHAWSVASFHRFQTKLLSTCCCVPGFHPSHFLLSWSMCTSNMGPSCESPDRF